MEFVHFGDKEISGDSGCNKDVKWDSSQFEWGRDNIGFCVLEDDFHLGNGRLSQIPPDALRGVPRVFRQNSRDMLRGLLAFIGAEDCESVGRVI